MVSVVEAFVLERENHCRLLVLKARFFVRNTPKHILMKSNASVSIVIVPLEDLCNPKINNHKFAASAAVRHKTGNFGSLDTFEARPIGRARKRSSEGIPVPVSGRE